MYSRKPTSLLRWGSQSLGSSFFLFFENEVYISPFPVSMNFPGPPWPPKLWFVTYLFCLPAPSGPVDVSYLVPWTWNFVSLIGHKPDLFLESVIPPSPIPSLPLLSLVWVSHLPSEDWGKAVVVYLSLLLVPSNQFSYTTLKYLNKHMKKPTQMLSPLHCRATFLH